VKQVVTNKQLNANHIHRILIRSTNWIGDAVMTTPAVRAIRDHFSQAEISILAKPWVAPIFENSAHVDRVLIYDDKRRHKGMPGMLRLVREIRKHHFDAAILLQNAFEAAVIAFLSGIRYRIGYPTDGRGILLTHPVSLPPKIKRAHQTAYYLGILNGVGIRGTDPSLYLKLDSRIKMKVQGILRDHEINANETIVGINPSATFGPAKQWFPESFARLADRLIHELECRILIFGGPGDRELGVAISKMMQYPSVNLSGKTRLEEAMGLMAACRLFITNDSGLMHVAAALNVPLVAIFGSTNPTTTGPWSDRAKTIHIPLSCSPCLKPECPEGHLNCMKQIQVDTVLSAVEEML
jgi:heptosyltransferase-2